MANRHLVATLIGAVLALGIGCGGTDDDIVFFPTPTQGPPTPTPLPICRGLEPPSGLGCRPFSWEQPTSNEESGTQLFTTLGGAAGFTVLPSLAGDGKGIDPGGDFVDLPPGFGLVAGERDVTGRVPVTIGVTRENQRPTEGFFIIGIKPVIDYICFKIDLATVSGTLYCDGDDAGVDTRVTGPAGVITQDDMVIEPASDEDRFGEPAPPGSLMIRAVQQLGRIDQGSDPRYETCLTLPECEPGQTTDCYRPRQEIIFTTGTAFGSKGATPLLNPTLTEGVTGEPFDCNSWTTTDGPGQLVQGFIDTDTRAPPTFDVATGLRIDD